MTMVLSAQCSIDRKDHRSCFRSVCIGGSGGRLWEKLVFEETVDGDYCIGIWAGKGCLEREHKGI